MAKVISSGASPDEQEASLMVDAVDNDGAAGGRIVLALKSCMKQQQQLLQSESNGSMLREPLLSSSEADQSDENNSTGEVNGGEPPLVQDERNGKLEEDACDGDAGRSSSNSGSDAAAGEAGNLTKRHVKWVDDGLGKDIAEVREFEASDQDDDEGCVQAGQCRCVVQ